jgi:signal transduction histidine kinase
MSELALSPGRGKRLLRAVRDAAAKDESAVLRRRLRRLALDVHDGPMQSLVAIGYALAQLRDGLESRQITEADAAAHIQLLADELAGAEQGLRGLINSLESAGSASLAPIDAIARTELERFRSISEVQAVLVVRGSTVPDTHSQEIAFRSVLREALNNVAKHASAKAVEVVLDADDEMILLEVADDGRGFDPDGVNGDRIGLVSMRERLQFLGGELELESKAGGPTRLRATLRRWQPEKR